MRSPTPEADARIARLYHDVFVLKGKKRERVEKGKAVRGVSVSVYIPKENWVQLLILSRKQNRSLSAVAAKLIDEGLD